MNNTWTDCVTLQNLNNAIAEAQGITEILEARQVDGIWRVRFQGSKALGAPYHASSSEGAILEHLLEIEQDGNPKYAKHLLDVWAASRR